MLAQCLILQIPFSSSFEERTDIVPVPIVSLIQVFLHCSAG